MRYTSAIAVTFAVFPNTASIFFRLPRQPTSFEVSRAAVAARKPLATTTYTYSGKNSSNDVTRRLQRWAIHAKSAPPLCFFIKAVAAE